MAGRGRPIATSPPASRASALPPDRHRDVDGRDQNILLVGNDDRDTATPNELAQIGTQSDGGSLNTDTMMLMHVPADGRKASVISFPRDTYVPIPGHGKDKLNSAYTWGIKDGHGSKTAGAALLRDTIENLTGLQDRSLRPGRPHRFLPDLQRNRRCRPLPERGRAPGQVAGRGPEQHPRSRRRASSRTARTSPATPTSTCTRA